MGEGTLRETAHVVHEDDVKMHETDRGRCGNRRRLLGMAAGGAKLGCSLYEVPPGKRSFPYHWHAANEEAIYVLEGEGTLRLAGREVPIRKGTYATFPTGEDGAHQVINTSAVPLRYLCLSTMISPEVAFYPDSDKISMFVGGAPGEHGARRIVKVVPGSAEAGYWDGEE